MSSHHSVTCVVFKHDRIEEFLLRHSPSGDRVLGIDKDAEYAARYWAMLVTEVLVLSGRCSWSKTKSMPAFSARAVHPISPFSLLACLCLLSPSAPTRSHPQSCRSSGLRAAKMQTLWLRLWSCVS